ncbi:MAG TPA: MFS transporter [Thermomicrobiaceae bacterium]|nr:MFS transporter [Thermomicrobiaceae bacterium]
MSAEAVRTAWDDRIPRLPLTILCLSVLGVYASTYLLISVLPVHIRQLGHSDTTVGTIMGTFSLAALLVRPFAGLAADRIGRRPSVFVGGMLIGLSCLGYAAAGADTVVFARILNGLGWGAVTAATATVAADLASPRRRGTVLGIYGMVTGAAFAIGPSAGIWLTAHVGLRASFFVAAASGFGGGLAILLLRVPTAHVSTHPAQSTRFGLNHLFSPTATGPALIMFCFTLVYGAVLTFVPLMTIDRGLGSSGTFFAVFAGALIVLRISGGGLSDRLGRVKVVAPGFLSSGVAMLVLAGAHGELPLLLAALLFAGAFAFIQPATQAWAVDLSPAHTRGTTLATVIAAQDLGITLGTAAGGVLAGAFGWGGLFSIAASLSLAGLAAVWYTRRRERVIQSLRVA